MSQLDGFDGLDLTVHGSHSRPPSPLTLVVQRTRTDGQVNLARPGGQESCNYHNWVMIGDGMLLRGLSKDPSTPK